mmetsp:Transcript_17800/g.17135  ORF Transcript_17800/g.17135 Transcript_17800/m.17135 type:complete len:445 (-) Transcript_17800:46-1380(-)
MTYLPFVFTFLLCLKWCYSIEQQADWTTFKDDHRSGISDKRVSVGFRSRLLDFTCPSVLCLQGTNLDIYMHFVAGVDHKSGFALLVHKTCESLKLCISREKFYIILHSENLASTLSSPLPFAVTTTNRTVYDRENVDHGNKSIFQISTFFLEALGINHVSLWEGEFSSEKKMMRYLNLVKHLNSSRSIIYHSDVDEFPDSNLLTKALLELKNGSCDAIIGRWRDRISASGYPTDVLITPSIQNDDKKRNRQPTSFRTDTKATDAKATLFSLKSQFPMRCHFSSNFMPERTTKKVLVYRSNLRVSSGQHSVWCDISTGVNKTKKTNETMSSKDLNMKDNIKAWNYKEACSKHVSRRADKSTRTEDILDLLPPQTSRPRICRTQVLIDHYKWVTGVELHLFKRAVSYKKQGLDWWRQSYAILDHMRANKGRICTSCQEMGCELDKG